jgi:3-phosphoshikimate 1-carboxyvinyltransferase
MDVKIAKTTLKGTIKPPSSKSLTHRAFILSGLSSGRSEIENYLEGEDCSATLHALQDFGVKYSSEPNKIIFEEGITNSAKRIDCKNSGTTMRLLMGVATLFEEETVLTGDKSLRSRPIKDLVNAFRELGAEITDTEGRPPLTVKGPLTSTEVSITGNISSQYTSSLLIRLSIGNKPGKIKIIKPIVSRPYIVQTIEILSERGIKITQEENSESWDLTIIPRDKLNARNIKMPLDFSSAAFFIVAGCIGNNSIKVIGPSSNYSQADQKIIEIINNVHGNITTKRIEGNCNIIVDGSTKMEATEIDITSTPDLFPILCLLATQIKGTTRLFGARHLRFKETDRIKTTTELISRLGGVITPTDDGAIVEYGPLLGDTEIETYGDHRIAMTACIAATITEDPVKINNVDCVNVSYPNFLADLESLGTKIEVV